MADFKPPMNHQHCADAPQTFTPKDACDIALGLINARLALKSGNAVKSVKMGDRVTEYNLPDAKSIASMDSEIDRWCAVCAQVNPARYQAEGLAAYQQQFQRGYSVRLPERNWTPITGGRL